MMASAVAGPTWGQFVELFGVCGVYVHLQRVLGLRLGLLERGAVDDLGGALGEAGGVEGATEKHGDDQQRDDDLRAVARDRARDGSLGTVRGTAGRRLESVSPHCEGFIGGERGRL